MTSCSETPPGAGNSAPEAESITDSHPGGHSHQHARADSEHGSAAHDHHARENVDRGRATAIAIGDRVPDFKLEIEGTTWKLSELRKNTEMTSDGTLVLTFWCSFCHSCRNVEKQLDKLAKQHQGTVGVIALDASAGETAEGVAAFAAENGFTFPIALNPGGTAADIFGTRRTKTTVVIDSDGILRYCGQFSDQEHNFAEQALEALLAGEEIPRKKTRQKG